MSTATFSDRTELTNIKHKQVINGNPWDQLVVGKSTMYGMIQYFQVWTNIYSPWQVACDQLADFSCCSYTFPARML